MANRPLFLTGLAQDVIEHGACNGCKINAANGLAELGLLDEILALIGLPDPRPPEVPFLPPHAQRPDPEPALPDAVYAFTLDVSVPGAGTADDLRTTLDQLAADLGETVMRHGARLHALRRQGERPPGWGTSDKITSGS